MERLLAGVFVDRVGMADRHGVATQISGCAVRKQGDKSHMNLTDRSLFKTTTALLSVMAFSNSS